MISNHVQALEDELGVRLLNRTTRRVSLTEIGRDYYERCIQILAELEEADRVASALQLTPRGQLRVHCHTSIVRFVAPVVAKYLLANPEVSVDLRMGDQMIDLLDEGLDLAIRTYLPPDSSLVVRRLSGWRHVRAVLRPISNTTRRRARRPTSRTTIACATPFVPLATSGTSSTRPENRWRCAPAAIW